MGNKIGDINNSGGNGKININQGNKSYSESVDKRVEM